MEDRLLAWLRRIRPDVADTPPVNQAGALMDVLLIAFAAPLSLIGLIWLFMATDFSQIGDDWILFPILSGLAIFLTIFQFFVHIEMIYGAAASFSGTLTPVATGVALWVLGPNGIYISLVLGGLIAISHYLRHRPLSAAMRFNFFGNLFVEMSSATFVALIVLALYRNLGGTYPIEGLTVNAILPAVAATIVLAVLEFLMFFPLVLSILVMNTIRQETSPSLRFSLIAQLVFADGIILVLTWFSILGAAIYVEAGTTFLIFFELIFVLGAFITNRFSKTVDLSNQRTRELAHLQNLNRALIDAAPDGSTLPDILKTHVSNIFINTILEIRLFPDKLLLHSPETATLHLEKSIWDWLKENPKIHYFKKNQPRPWGGQEFTHTSQGLAPIFDRDTGAMIGGASVVLGRRTVQTANTIEQIAAAFETVTNTVEVALHRAKVYEATLAHEKVQQELLFAGNVQSSFLPTDIPSIAGWQLSALLDSARQTSGDFYDVILLNDGRLALVVADVADKGTGAALFMALSRTLLRTYAHEYPDDPSQVLAAANARILQDTRNDLFVTVFYGVLDVSKNTLTYANAGHNPVFVFRSNHEPLILKRTGIPLGMFEMGKWRSATVQLESDSVVVMYTDGVTEAQNNDAQLFGETRLIETVRSKIDSQAKEIQQAIIDEIYTFMEGAPQADDITLMVLARREQEAIIEVSHVPYS